MVFIQADSTSPAIRFGAMLGGKAYLFGQPIHRDLESEEFALSLVLKRVTFKMGKFVFRVSQLPFYVPYGRGRIVIEGDDFSFETLLSVDSPLVATTLSAEAQDLIPEDVKPLQRMHNSLVLVSS